jgi:Cdc6-like AAA superfamily ATPase
LSVDLSHLLAQYRPHALLPDDERIQWIQRDRWIHYSRAEHVLDRLTALLNCPPRNRMPCLLIFGSTGMGKTQAVQKFVRDHRSSFDETAGRTSLPVVTIQMPPAPHERDLYEEIMVAMGGVLVMGLGITTLRHRGRPFANPVKAGCGHTPRI